ncbi:MAG: S8 family serine peptidase [Coleofasciculus sp. D1-CHI-01]|uniref:S8 family serine peptidase n=1 Tax=Coleofasciculus sp. D1-CHI-01 TaxID=3068482 RepID=UPI0032F324A6
MFIVHILNFLSKNRPSPKGFQPQSTPAKVQRETFVLEPILTPSGLVDGMDDTPDLAGVELSSDPLDQVPIPEIDDISPDSILDNSISDEDLEEIPFITEEVSELEEPLNIVTLENPNPTFESGVFTVGDSGEVEIDFLFDGGGYRGELAIFSLEGMDQFEPGSEDFILEASSRALSDSELGHIVIADQTEGAKFSGQLGEGDQNAGEYLGAKSFVMRPGDKFGFMLVPNGQVQQVFDNPEIEGAVRPLFSLATANPDDGFHVGQIADVTGDGNTFVMEDLRVDSWTDRDYNDVIFQVRGATGEAVDLDDVIEGEDWRESQLGLDLISYAEESVFETELTNDVTEITQDADVAIDDLNITVDEELTTLPTDLDEALATPESILDDDFAQLPEDLGLAEDNLEAVLAEHLAQFPDDSERSSDDFTGDQPEEVQIALDIANNVLTDKLAEVETGLNNDLQELGDKPQEVHNELDALQQELDELKTALAAELSEIPAELQEALTEFDELIEVARSDFDTELDGSELKAILTEFAEDMDTSLATEEDSFLATPTYIGENNPISRNTLGNDYNFPTADQPLVGIIDTGFNDQNPDIDYNRIILGRDRLDNDDNPLLASQEGDEHGTHILGIIGATQDNSLGIDGINDDAPLWLGRAVESGRWAESLVEFVDAAQDSGQPHAVANLSFDLTEINPDGTVTTRSELTANEIAAIDYARQNGIILVVAAGNEGGEVSALGKAAQEFDNIVTVGAIEQTESEIPELLEFGVIEEIERAPYSNYGEHLHLVASGGTDDNPIVSTVDNGVGIMAGTSVAAAKVTGAISQVWAANPQLSYQQVIDILKSTATDLNSPGWDAETGAGVLNLDAAILMAVATTPLTADLPSEVTTPTLNQGSTTASERPAGFWSKVKKGFKKVGKGFKKAVNKIGDGAKKVTKKFANGVKSVVGKIGKGIKELGSKIGNKVKDFVGKVGGFVGKVGKGVKNVVKKVASTVWNGVKWVSRKLWYGLQGIYNRVKQWTNSLPSRLRRLVDNLWAGVKSLKPWSVSWWKSLGKAETWIDFLKWLGKNLIYVAEVARVGELYETAAEFLKFNTRPLNQREIDLARSVFGNAINYNLVRVDTKAVLALADSVWKFIVRKNKKLELKNRPLVTFNTINSWGPLEDDTFIHEMTHVWQYQQDGAIYMPQAIHAQKVGAGYDYLGLTELQARKDAGRGLTSFNREQQGAIIQDYYLLLNDEQPDHAANATCDHLPLYAHFVKDASTLTVDQLVGHGCSPPSPSDLSGKSFNVIEEPRDAGDSFTTEFEIQNTQANSSSGSFNVDFYISSNDFISTSDRYLGSYLVGNILGNSSTGTLNKTLTLPSKGDSFWNSLEDGTYYIGMIVDGDGDVAETNESNNQNTGEFKDYDAVQINDTQPVVNAWSSSGSFDDFKQQISDRWDQGFELTSVERGDDRWFGVFGEDERPNAWSYSGNFDTFKQQISDRWDTGHNLIDVEYGDGRWFGVFGSDKGRNAYSSSGNFDTFTQQISDRWDQDYELVDVGYGDGRWFGVFSENTGRNAYSSSGNFDTFDQQISDRWDAGFDLINVEYGDGRWFGVFGPDKGRNAYSSSGNFDEFQQQIEERWDEGFEMVDVGYGDGRWFGVFQDD